MAPRATVHRHVEIVRYERLLGFGSREWTHRALVRAWLLWFVRQGGKTVMHGAARGADRIIGQEADRLGLEVLPFEVSDFEWKLSKRAGHNRNQRMLDEGRPDFAIGFVVGEDGTPLTPGSCDMHTRLVRANVPTTVLRGF